MPEKSQATAESLSPQPLDSVHHIALTVEDVAAAAVWYRDKFRCEVAYEDATWAMLRFENCDLALVAAGGHPAHIGFLTNAEKAERFGTLKPHRDGTRSVYLADPSGNSVELLVDDRPGRSQG